MKRCNFCNAKLILLRHPTKAESVPVRQTLAADTTRRAQMPYHPAIHEIHTVQECPSAPLWIKRREAKKKEQQP